MNRTIFGLFPIVLLLGCLNPPQDEPATCQKLRRKMAYIKHTDGPQENEEYRQLKQIYKEFDCA